MTGLSSVAITSSLFQKERTNEIRSPHFIVLSFADNVANDLPDEGNCRNLRPGYFRRQYYDRADKGQYQECRKGQDGGMDKNPNSNPAIFLNNSLFSVWTAAKQFQEFTGYIRACGPRLRIAGFDCQLSGKNSEIYLADSLRAFIKRYRPEMRIDTDLLADVIASFAESFSFPSDLGYGKFLNVINSVIRMLSKIASRQHLPANEAALADFWENFKFPILNRYDDKVPKTDQVR